MLFLNSHLHMIMIKVQKIETMFTQCQKIPKCVEGEMEEVVQDALARDFFCALFRQVQTSISPVF